MHAVRPGAVASLCGCITSASDGQYNRHYIRTKLGHWASWMTEKASNFPLNSRHVLLRGATLGGNGSLEEFPWTLSNLIVCRRPSSAYKKIRTIFAIPTYTTRPPTLTLPTLRKPRLEPATFTPQSKLNLNLSPDHFPIFLRDRGQVV